MAETITLRKSEDRGRTRLDWLDSRHSFSFADYHDPRFMRFRSLRVINEDWIKGGGGFGWHGHRDMEILTYIVAGRLRHQDSMGTGSVIEPDDVQIMSAGTGIMHSEFNDLADRETHLLQIWMMPAQSGLATRYAQRRFPPEAKRNRLCRVGSASGREGAVQIFQDVELFSARLEKGKTLEYDLAAERYAWLQIVTGAIEIEGQKLNAGDGAAIRDLSKLRFAAASESEFLLFDLG